LVSFITCALTSIPAIILGVIGLGEIKRSAGQIKGTGMAATGIVTGAMAIAGVVMILPVLLLVPAIGAAREAARRNGCFNNLRQLGFATADHEQTLNTYPAASMGTADLLRAQRAGDHGTMLAASNDGVSWLYQLLPFIEEKMLAGKMKNAMHQDDVFTGPFDENFANPDTGERFAKARINVFICPTYSGANTTNLGGVDAAVGNYCAYVGTDTHDPGTAPWKRSSNNWEDGALPSACWKQDNSQTSALAVGSCKDRGIRAPNLGDGISKTIIACETREEVYSAWISGASMWVVATSPNSLAADGVALGHGEGFLQVSGGGKSGEGLALNFGSRDPSSPASEKYFQAGDWATAADRAWGPSSEHAANVVLHVWADSHAKAINFEEVDPTVYLYFITRSAGDPASEANLAPVR
jgi:hypothetical protein